MCYLINGQSSFKVVNGNFSLVWTGSEWGYISGLGKMQTNLKVRERVTQSNCDKKIKNQLAEGSFWEVTSFCEHEQKLDKYS